MNELTPSLSSAVFYLKVNNLQIVWYKILTHYFYLNSSKSTGKLLFFYNMFSFSQCIMIATHVYNIIDIHSQIHNAKLVSAKLVLSSYRFLVITN